MARKPIHRQLPPLDKLFAAFSGFAPHENHRQRLLILLRDATHRIQSRHDVPFYSMREIGSFFGMPHRSVLFAYRQLEVEGLLQAVRGSQTLLRGNVQQPRPWLRGVVAIPISTQAFVAFADWRLFFRSLEEQLRRRHWVGDLIFFDGEELQPDFVDRVLDHHANSVLWFCPHPVHRPTLEWLKDAGLRVMNVLDRPVDFPGHATRVNWEDGLKAALQDWQRQGIDEVILPQSTKETTSATHVLGKVLGLLGLTHTIARLPPLRHMQTRFIPGLPANRRVGIVWDDDAFCGEMATRFPDQMVHLFRRVRCLVMRPLRIPPTVSRDARVDALLMDWPAVAEHLARLVDQPALPLDNPLPLLAAHYHPRMPAGRLLDITLPK